MISDEIKREIILNHLQGIEAEKYSLTISARVIKSVDEDDIKLPEIQAQMERLERIKDAYQSELDSLYPRVEAEA